MTCLGTRSMIADWLLEFGLVLEPEDPTPDTLLTNRRPHEALGRGNDYEV